MGDFDTFRTRIPKLLGLVVVALVLAVSARAAHAATTALTVYNGLQHASTIRMPEALSSIHRWNVALGDVDGDGRTDTVLAGGVGERAIIAILARDGTLKRTFDVYPRSFRGGLEVAVGDLNGDGTAEILTAPAGGGGPDVRVFDARGSVQLRFDAFDPKFRGGVRLGVGDVTGDGLPEIVVGAGPDGGPQVRVFDAKGRFTGKQWFAFSRTLRSGVYPAVGDFNGDGVGEVAVASSATPGTVTIYRANGTLLSSFTPFPQGAVGGVRIVALDVNGDGIAEIVATPVTNERRIAAFRMDGTVVQSVTPPVSTAGVVLAAGRDRTLMVVPNQPAVTGRADLPKSIMVDISEQKLRIYEYGRLLSQRSVSTGKWSTPTPIGTFQVRNKVPVAYSRSFDLYMDWWMAFTPDGAYGVHSLPYWKLKNGGRFYEGTGHIGRRVSHGCIRQTLLDAKTLYDWAAVGTPVIVTK